MPAEKKYEEIGARLKALRLALHDDMSITAYAKFLEVGYTQYLNWESGLNRPLPDEGVRLCQKLGVTMDFIYRGIEAALPQNTLKSLSERSLLRAQSTSTDNPDTSAD